MKDTELQNENETKPELDIWLPVDLSLHLMATRRVQNKDGKTYHLTTTSAAVSVDALLPGEQSELLILKTLYSKNQ